MPEDIGRASLLPTHPALVPVGSLPTGTVTTAGEDTLVDEEHAADGMLFIIRPNAVPRVVASV